MLHGATRVRRDPVLQEVPMQTIVEDRRLPAEVDAQPVVQAAAALKPTVRHYHDEIEREQRLSPELVEQMHAAGFYRLLLPRSLGGLQADPLTYIRVVELLAEGAGSVGWNVANNGVGSLVTLGLPDDGVQEIYPKGHRTVIAGTAVQGGGQAVSVEGGYRVSGRWTFGSGCHEAAWMLGSFQILDDGQPRRRDDGGMFWRGLFPRAEVEVIPGSWEVSGLRGTGSFDWTVRDFFLPERRTMVHAGVPLDNQWGHWPGITYALPAPAWVGPHQCAVITGLARAGIDALVELAADKTPRGRTGRLCDNPQVQDAVGRADAILNAGRLYRNAMIAELWNALAGVVSDRRPRLPRARPRPAAALAGREQVGHVSPWSPQNLAVRGLVARVAQYAAGEVAGVGAFLHQHPAVYKGGVDAGRRLLEAPAAGREIVHDK